ncbi:DUF6075 family protein [Tepidibacter thalassicus]|uniref:Uncharacterized protein n=1 Tax=Tepidibacter thalassicus DSM 15285 TaxID=1123350 RepID=A0A1M5NJR6_9FIRM|nr:DUF6075 family protein [Tepidibacter thalassicus]SHG89758.1 hypothetical protein SAMN02744040_00079 [Tepidibacter thalassicus DSM 15285]
MIFDEMIFKDEKHKTFFKEQVEKTRSRNDPYRKALFYVWGLTEETRENIESLYNFKEKAIDFEGLNKSWQTGTTIKVCRLAFNLYNGLYGQQDESESAMDYTPYGIFDCGLIDYMLEAVKIRFEEYKGLPF